MAYTIALAGKGGTGKTTLASLIVSSLRDQRSGSILAVDADPNSNLAESLGLEVAESIGSVLDQIAAAPDQIPAGMTKERFIDYKIQTAIAEGDGFDVLTMGKPEGPGCYCYVNNVLRGLMARLIDDYDYVVIDNEAGLEHLSRRTTRRADLFLVVADNTVVSLRAAGRIRSLADELKIESASRYLVVNRLSAPLDDEQAARTGLTLAGSIPLDEQIEKLSRSGGSLSALPADTPARAAAEKLLSMVKMKGRA